MRRDEGVWRVFTCLTSTETSSHTSTLNTLPSPPTKASPPSSLAIALPTPHLAAHRANRKPIHFAVYALKFAPGALEYRS